MNSSQLRLINENGQEELFDVLLNITSEEFKKSYLVVCPTNFEAVDGQISVMPLAYTADEEGNITSISEIETREEFEFIKAEFEKMMDSMHEHDCCCGHDHEECCCEHDHEEEACCCGHDHDE